MGLGLTLKKNEKKRMKWKAKLTRVALLVPVLASF